MRRLVAAIASAVLAVLLLAGCGSSSSIGGTASGQEPKVIDVSINGDSATPNGELVKVSVGQPIELDVTADAPGEIHVHSSPEQEFEYKAGEQTITVDPINAPGRVEVESHTLEKTLFTLQAQ